MRQKLVQLDIGSEKHARRDERKHRVIECFVRFDSVNREKYVFYANDFFTRIRAIQKQFMLYTTRTVFRTFITLFRGEGKFFFSLWNLFTSWYRQRVTCGFIRDVYSMRSSDRRVRRRKNRISYLRRSGYANRSTIRCTSDLNVVSYRNSFVMPSYKSCFKDTSANKKGSLL